MASIIQLRRDTAANWTSANPILAQGELGVETDTLKIKIGNGSSAWNSLSYLINTNGYVTLTGSQTISGKTITGLIETKGSLTSGTIIVADSGNYFTSTVSGTISYTVVNTPPSGSAYSFILELTNGGSGTITWWSGVKWAGGTAPTLTSAGKDILGFYTHDGGTTWNGLVLGKDVK